MDLKINNSPNFNAKLIIRSSVQNYGMTKDSIKNIQTKFSEITKDKEGVLSIFLTYNDWLINSDQIVMRLGRGNICQNLYRTQSAYPSNEWMYDFAEKKNDTEKAQVLTKIFEVLQEIPQKVSRRLWHNDEYRQDIYNNVVKNLGDDKYNLTHMFEHLKEYNMTGSRV